MVRFFLNLPPYTCFTMLTILGPAKTIDTSPHGITRQHSFPDYLEQSEQLVEQLRGYPVSRLKSLMKVSDKLATLTYERYASWKRSYSEDEGQLAIMAFSGEVFNGLKARTLTEEDLLFAQDHMRILSGLYGVLRPLDLILPYRLEIGTNMKTGRHKDLYEFWKATIPARITEDTGNGKTRVLINLASQEYFRSIRPESFPYQIITPVFKESDGEGFRNVTIYAKKARGMMLRFIIRNRISNPEHLKAFDEDGYHFYPPLSGDKDWFFCR